MPPKKTKKKNKNEDSDEEFAEKEKAISKWAQVLDSKEEEEPDAQELYSKPTKAIFEFDFSRQRDLDLHQPQKKPNIDKMAQLTEEEKIELEKLKLKAKQDKEVKNQIKNEKKKERQKEIELKKIEQENEKLLEEEEKKKIEEEIKKSKSKESSPWVIPLGLLLFMVLMFFMQYQKEIHERLAKFKNDSVDYYKILEADQGITDKELKAKYKKLVMRYHPDRNPDCKDCKEKFDQIMQAWEILGDHEKRKSYDQNSGYISELKSASQTLTPQNYDFLVEESEKLWLIQVFDSTNQYSRYFAQFWEELVTQYSDIVEFGRIDIWLQSDMASYIPYKFQVFPSVYYMHKGESEICSFNFERPLEGIRKCIEEFYKKQEQTVVTEVSQKIVKSSKKMSVFLDGKLRANTRVKAINKEFEKYFDFYYVEPNTGRNCTLFKEDKNYTFNFTENSKKVFKAYKDFLRNFVIEEISLCRFLHVCDEIECAVVLNKTIMPKLQKMLPFDSKKKQNPPIFVLKDSESFAKSLESLEQELEFHEKSKENYEICVFGGGRVDVGYLEDFEELNVEMGERIELECKIYTWTDWATEIIKNAIEIVRENVQKYFGAQEETKNDEKL